MSGSPQMIVLIAISLICYLRSLISSPFFSSCLKMQVRDLLWPMPMLLLLLLKINLGLCLFIA